MQDRRQAEIELLRRRYGDLEVGANLDWALFKAFPVPPGWSTKVTELLVMIPQGYPLTPPDNFYVSPGFRLSSGSQAGNFSEVSLLGRQWGQFSFHPDKEQWKPSPDILDGHNLLTFMLQVEQRLRELN